MSTATVRLKTCLAAAALLVALAGLATPGQAQLPALGGTVEADLKAPARDGDLKISSCGGDLYQLQINVGTTDLCLGNLEAAGRQIGDVIEFAPVAPQTPAARNCRIIARIEKDGFIVRERNCGAFHGKGCLFDGAYKTKR